MHKPTDREYLLGSQYKDTSALNARVQIHRFSANKQGLTAWIFSHLDLPQHCDILELGCGSGGLWQTQGRLISDGWRITLTDFSPGILEETRKNLASAPRPFEFAIVDAQSIPFEDNKFDAVIANHMLYHVPDRNKALSEIRRVLRPGGKLYASTVGIGHMLELQELCHRLDARIDLASDSVAEEFGLENGAQQLGRFFGDVCLHIYDDHLLVPEAKPIVDYLLSMRDAVPLLDSIGLDALMKAVEDELSRARPIKITKRIGLFVAS